MERESGSVSYKPARNTPSVENRYEHSLLIPVFQLFKYNRPMLLSWAGVNVGQDQPGVKQKSGKFRS
jgi:hypothetical protein